MDTLGFERAAALLPVELRRRALALPAEKRKRAEELRLRCGNPATVLLPEGEWHFSASPVSTGLLRAVMETATGASLHTAMEQLRQGFVTVRGGVRVGVCGTAVKDSSGVICIKQFSSLSIRIPRQATGCADTLMPLMQPLRSTLLLAPPGAGKTTLLRELIRNFSNQGIRIGLCDERGEVAAVWNGVPQFDIGSCTDVLSAIPKAEGTMVLLRAMNPQVIAMDEITERADLAACIHAAGCGVSLLATAHGAHIEDLQRRPLYRALVREGIFRKVVMITNEAGLRRYRMEELSC